MSHQSDGGSGSGLVNQEAAPSSQDACPNPIAAANGPAVAPVPTAFDVALQALKLAASAGDARAQALLAVAECATPAAVCGALQAPAAAGALGLGTKRQHPEGSEHEQAEGGSVKRQQRAAEGTPPAAGTGRASAGGAGGSAGAAEVEVVDLLDDIDEEDEQAAAGAAAPAHLPHVARELEGCELLFSKSATAAPGIVSNDRHYIPPKHHERFAEHLGLVLSDRVISVKLPHARLFAARAPALGSGAGPSTSSGHAPQQGLTPITASASVRLAHYPSRTTMMLCNLLPSLRAAGLSAGDVIDMWLGPKPGDVTAVWHPTSVATAPTARVANTGNATEGGACELRRQLLPLPPTPLVHSMRGVLPGAQLLYVCPAPAVGGLKLLRLVVSQLAKHVSLSLGRRINHRVQVQCKAYKWSGASSASAATPALQPVSLPREVSLCVYHSQAQPGRFDAVLWGFLPCLRSAGLRAGQTLGLYLGPEPRALSVVWHAPPNSSSGDDGGGGGGGASAAAAALLKPNQMLEPHRGNRAQQQQQQAPKGLYGRAAALAACPQLTGATLLMERVVGDLGGKPQANDLFCIQRNQLRALAKHTRLTPTRRLQVQLLVTVLKASRPPGASAGSGSITLQSVVLPSAVVAVFYSDTEGAPADCRLKHLLPQLRGQGLHAGDCLDLWLAPQRPGLFAVWTPQHVALQLSKVQRQQQGRQATGGARAGLAYTLPPAGGGRVQRQQMQQAEGDEPAAKRPRVGVSALRTAVAGAVVPASGAGVSGRRQPQLLLSCKASARPDIYIPSAAVSAVVKHLGAAMPPSDVGDCQAATVELAACRVVLRVQPTAGRTLSSSQAALHSLSVPGCLKACTRKAIATWEYGLGGGFMKSLRRAGLREGDALQLFTGPTGQQLMLTWTPSRSGAAAGGAGTRAASEELESGDESDGKEEEEEESDGDDDAEDGDYSSGAPRLHVRVAQAVSRHRTPRLVVTHAPAPTAAAALVQQGSPAISRTATEAMVLHPQPNTFRIPSAPAPRIRQHLGVSEAEWNSPDMLPLDLLLLKRSVNVSGTASAASAAAKLTALQCKGQSYVMGKKMRMSSVSRPNDTRRPEHHRIYSAMVVLAAAGLAAGDALDLYLGPPGSKQLLLVWTPQAGGGGDVHGGASGSGAGSGGSDGGTDAEEGGISDVSGPSTKPVTGAKAPRRYSRPSRLDVTAAPAPAAAATAVQQGAPAISRTASEAMVLRPQPNAFAITSAQAPRIRQHLGVSEAEWNSPDMLPLDLLLLKRSVDVSGTASAASAAGSITMTALQCLGQSFCVGKMFCNKAGRNTGRPQGHRIYYAMIVLAAAGLAAGDALDLYLGPPGSKQLLLVWTPQAAGGGGVHGGASGSGAGSDGSDGGTDAEEGGISDVSGPSTKPVMRGKARKRYSRPSRLDVTAAPAPAAAAAVVQQGAPAISRTASEAMVLRPQPNAFALTPAQAPRIRQHLGVSEAEWNSPDMLPLDLLLLKRSVDASGTASAASTAGNITMTALQCLGQSFSLGKQFCNKAGRNTGRPQGHRIYSAMTVLAAAGLAAGDALDLYLGPPGSKQLLLVWTPQAAGGGGVHGGASGSGAGSDGSDGGTDAEEGGISDVSGPSTKPVMRGKARKRYSRPSRLDVTAAPAPAAAAAVVQQGAPAISRTASEAMVLRPQPNAFALTPAQAPRIRQHLGVSEAEWNSPDMLPLDLLLLKRSVDASGTASAASTAGNITMTALQCLGQSFSLGKQFCNKAGRNTGRPQGHRIYSAMTVLAAAGLAAGDALDLYLGPPGSKQLLLVWTPQAAGGGGVHGGASGSGAGSDGSDGGTDAEEGGISDVSGPSTKPVMRGKARKRYSRPSRLDVTAAPAPAAAAAVVQQGAPAISRTASEAMVLRPQPNAFALTPAQAPRIRQHLGVSEAEWNSPDMLPLDLLLLKRSVDASGTASAASTAGNITMTALQCLGQSFSLGKQFCNKAGRNTGRPQGHRIYSAMTVLAAAGLAAGDALDLYLGPPGSKQLLLVWTPQAGGGGGVHGGASGSGAGSGGSDGGTDAEEGGIRDVSGPSTKPVMRAKAPRRYSRPSRLDVTAAPAPAAAAAQVQQGEPVTSRTASEAMVLHPQPNCFLITPAQAPRIRQHLGVSEADWNSPDMLPLDLLLLKRGSRGAPNAASAGAGSASAAAGSGDNSMMALQCSGQTKKFILGKKLHTQAGCVTGRAHSHRIYYAMQVLAAAGLAAGDALDLYLGPPGSKQLLLVWTPQAGGGGGVVHGGASGSGAGSDDSDPAARQPAVPSVGMATHTHGAAAGGAASSPSPRVVITSEPQQQQQQQQQAPPGVSPAQQPPAQQAAVAQPGPSTQHAPPPGVPGLLFHKPVTGMPYQKGYLGLPADAVLPLHAHLGLEKGTPDVTQAVCVMTPTGQRLPHAHVRCYESKVHPGTHLYQLFGIIRDLRGQGMAEGDVVGMQLSHTPVTAGGAGGDGGAGAPCLIVHWWRVVGA